jgi:hypothetical protein
MKAFNYKNKQSPMMASNTTASHSTVRKGTPQQSQHAAVRNNLDICINSQRECNQK